MESSPLCLGVPGCRGLVKPRLPGECVVSATGTRCLPLGEVFGGRLRLVVDRQAQDAVPPVRAGVPEQDMRGGVGRIVRVKGVDDVGRLAEVDLVLVRQAVPVTFRRPQAPQVNALVEHLDGQVLHWIVLLHV